MTVQIGDAVIRLAVARPQRWGFLDRIDVERIGIVRLFGWSHSATADLAPPTVALDGHALLPLKLYRFDRPDVAAQPGRLMRQAGVVLEYRVPADLMRTDRHLAAIEVDGESLSVGARFAPIEAHYGSLIETDQVLQREHIYAVGPPNPDVNPSVLSQLESIRGPVLDFGCGSGALVSALRARGLDAYGLEIDRPAIRESLHDSVRPFITLYDGALPSPYESGHFATVVSSEVLEHIPDYRAALAEMARLSRETVVLTVPDCEAIPRGFPHHVVPWHLLEASHLHFFTQCSLEAALRPHFSQVEFGRMGAFRINDSEIHDSLVAVCVK